VIRSPRGAACTAAVVVEGQPVHMLVGGEDIREGCRDPDSVEEDIDSFDRFAYPDGWSPFTISHPANTISCTAIGMASSIRVEPISVPPPMTAATP